MGAEAAGVGEGGRSPRRGAQLLMAVAEATSYCWRSLGGGTPPPSRRGGKWPPRRALKGAAKTRVKSPSAIRPFLACLVLSGGGGACVRGGGAAAPRAALSSRAPRSRRRSAPGVWLPYHRS